MRSARGRARNAFGLAFSETGIINDADVTIHYVLPDSPAARAGLQAGDKLVSLGGEAAVRDPAAARSDSCSRLPKPGASRSKLPFIAVCRTRTPRIRGWTCSCPI